MAGLTKEQKAAKAAEDAAKEADEQARAVEGKAVELSGLTADEFAVLPDDERAKLIEQAQAEILAAKPDPEKPAAKPKADDSHLIALTKDGDALKVHPSCVDDHKSLGWLEA